MAIERYGQLHPDSIGQENGGAQAEASGRRRIAADLGEQVSKREMRQCRTEASGRRRIAADLANNYLNRR